MTAKAADFAKTTPTERKYVRASLVISDPLMRSLGRPNREQVVTANRTVEHAPGLDLSNGAISRMARPRRREHLKANVKASPRN